jgi:dihydrodipicolinate reductase
MGRAVLSCVLESEDLKLTGAITEPGDRLLGRDAAELLGAEPFGVPLTDDRTQGDAARSPDCDDGARRPSTGA